MRKLCFRKIFTEVGRTEEEYFFNVDDEDEDEEEDEGDVDEEEDGDANGSDGDGCWVPLTIHLNRNSPCLGRVDLVVLGHARDLLVVHLSAQPEIMMFTVLFARK